MVAILLDLLVPVEPVAQVECCSAVVVVAVVDTTVVVVAAVATLLKPVVVVAVVPPWCSPGWQQWATTTETGTSP